MDKFPQLTTDRLLLRKLTVADLPTLIQNVNNPDIARQILNIPYPYGEADAVARLHLVNQGFENRQRYVFAITVQGENEVIGEIGLNINKEHNHAEFGYWITESHWGKGIASEATAAILKFGFEQLKIHKIFATHFEDNPASGRVMQKNGMIKEAELFEHYIKDGAYGNSFQYRLTVNEYNALHGNETR